MKTTWMQRIGFSVLATSVLFTGLAMADMTATHKETGVLGDKGPTKSKSISSFCLDASDNLVVCDQKEKVIRVLKPDGTLKTTWKLEFAPQIIKPGKKDTMVVAGKGQVAIFDKEGKVQAKASLPIPAVPETWLKRAKTPKQRKALLAQYKGMMSNVTGLALLGDEIFVAARANTGYCVYRLGKNLKESKVVIKGLRGCCGQMDICANDKGNKLFVAHNSKHCVEVYDRKGKKLSTFGKRARSGDEGFGSCCNPMNVLFGPGGELYTSESGLCRVKRYSPEGKLLGVVGKTGIAGGCKRMTIAITKDASKIYMLDTKKNKIRVMTGPAKAAEKK